MDSRTYDNLRNQAALEYQRKLDEAKREFDAAIRGIEWVRSHASNGRITSNLNDDSSSSDTSGPQSRGALLAAIRRVISQMNPLFTLGEVLGELQLEHPEIQAFRRKASIGSALSRMVAVGEIEVSEKGKRGAQQIYRKPKKGDS